MDEAFKVDEEEALADVEALGGGRAGGGGGGESPEQRAAALRAAQSVR